MTQYLRLLLRDQDEAVVVDEIAVNILAKRSKRSNVDATGSDHDEKLERRGTFLTWLSQLMLHFPSRAVHCTQNTSGFAVTRLVTSVLFPSSSCLLVRYLSASSPELPLEELELHLDANS